MTENSEASSPRTIAFSSNSETLSTASDAEHALLEAFGRAVIQFERLLEVKPTGLTRGPRPTKSDLRKGVEDVLTLGKFTSESTQTRRTIDDGCMKYCRKKIQNLGIFSATQVENILTWFSEFHSTSLSAEWGNLYTRSKRRATYISLYFNLCCRHINDIIYNKETPTIEDYELARDMIDCLQHAMMSREVRWLSSGWDGFMRDFRNVRKAADKKCKENNISSADNQERRRTGPLNRARRWFLHLGERSTS